jgi:cytidylate kinase
MIIAIDGPAGSGKSTIAKLLAETLHFVYFDTGAMYRAVTYCIIRDQIPFRDPKALEQFLNSFRFEIKLINNQKHYFANGIDVTREIRTQPVTALVSEVSALPTVRAHLVQIQQQFAVGNNAVFEGRDMGTVVFPNAELKIFLTARPEVRAQRRLSEMQQKDPEQFKKIDLEAMLADINRRDVYDSTREVSPLRPASDSHQIDTSDLTIPEIVEAIVRLTK